MSRVVATVRRPLRVRVLSVLAVLGLAGALVSWGSLIPSATSAAATGKGHATARHATARHATARHATARHATARHATARHKARHHKKTGKHAHGHAGPSVTTSMARWRLPNPLSRAGASPLPGGRVLLLGGLFSSGASSADVAVLDTANGALTTVATLPSPTHDAGSATVNGTAFLFGGGQSTPFGLVQGVTVPVAGHAATTTATGQLPQARADAEAVTMGHSAYVVGGYNGYIGDAAVLQTANGTTFSPVVTLPVAVRYAAVTAANGNIYVFGGESEQGGTTEEFSTPTGTTTPPPGQQVATVQEIDTRTHTAKVIGSLPHAVQGAAAFVLGGHIFLAGGDSYAPGSPPASGSTIWSFDPSTVSFHVAGHLAAPISYAALAVEGHTAWLIGGERNGAQVATAQKVVLRRSH